ncbi:MAG: flagellar basal body-associated FliL family protein [Syntrophomonadaceae bacterium]|nr:flagellar basal body-associated FliL family protein [Syntrophomonadaceae bacterium]
MSEETNGKTVKTSGIGVGLIVFGIVLFMLTTAGCYFVIKSALAPLVPQEMQNQSKANGFLVQLGEFTVNISDVSMSRFLKTEIVIEVTDSKIKKSMEEEQLPVVRDLIISILSSKTVADLDSPHRARLKEEIKNQLNKRYKNAVSNVYFNSFIMQ